MQSLQELLYKGSMLKPKADIITALKRCARKAVTFSPASYGQISDALEKIDFSAQE